MRDEARASAASRRMPLDAVLYGSIPAAAARQASPPTRRRFGAEHRRRAGCRRNAYRRADARIGFISAPGAQHGETNACSFSPCDAHQHYSSAALYHYTTSKNLHDMTQRPIQATAKHLARTAHASRSSTKIKSCQFIVEQVVSSRILRGADFRFVRLTAFSPARRSMRRVRRLRCR